MVSFACQFLTVDKYCILAIMIWHEIFVGSITSKRSREITMLCVFYEAKNVQLRIKKPTRCHLIFYYTSYRLNMFQALLCPSSGARDYDVVYHVGRIVLGLL